MVIVTGATGHINKTKPLFTTYSVDVLASNSLVSSEKARLELGYSARPVRDSVADAVWWFKESGYTATSLGRQTKGFS
jgi:dihydroflavonol-4-reductase